jgi:hypothetical protein
MSIERRKSVRRAVALRAFLYTPDGWPLGECKLHDISATGARLGNIPKADLPARFLLSLSRTGSVRRACTVRWQNRNEVGVRFEVSNEVYVAMRQATSAVHS